MSRRGSTGPVWAAVVLLTLLGSTAGVAVGDETGEQPAGRESTEMEESPAAAERSDPSQLDDVSVDELRVKILAEYPHDPRAFTQGLIWDGGLLYESTGLYGRSALLRVDPASGEVLARTGVDPNLFGEGLARVDDRLFQLTWKAGLALVYEIGSLELIDQFSYRGEGWGLTYDGERLIMSDGSSFLTLRDAADFRVLDALEVRLRGQPAGRLNELEYAEGQIYANVWDEEYLLRIDPRTGRVTASIDARGLLTPGERQRTDVLNGIAYDAVSKTFWLTGKFWPKLFQVVFEPVPERR